MSHPTKMNAIRFGEINDGWSTKLILHIERVELVNNFKGFLLTFDQALYKHWQRERSVPKL
jgi:hypothetical protein